MGGGNLNLKKSWHPSTLKNQEKVWKAQQQDESEKKKLEELRKELQAQREKEEFQNIADRASGSTESATKMDWMYKGVSALADREDYLLGRKVDKTFDVIKAAEEANEKGQHGDEKSEGLPSQLFKRKQTEADFTPVDMAIKVREDPLYMIKKQEYESKKELLSNPVKMKMLQEMISKEKSKKHKKSKKKKKHRKDSKPSGSSESESSPEREIRPSVHKRREDARSSESRQQDSPTRNRIRSPNELSKSEHGDGRSSGKRRRSAERKSHRNPPKNWDSQRGRSRSPQMDRSVDRPGDRANQDAYRQERNDDQRQRSWQSAKLDRNRSPETKKNRRSPESSTRSKHRDRCSPERSNRSPPPTNRAYGLIKVKDASEDANYVKKDYRLMLEERRRREEKERCELKERLKKRSTHKMTQDEREAKLREMQQDAVIRDKQREDYVQRHTKGDAIVVEDYREGGFRGAEMLSKAVDKSNIESRLKSNLKGLKRASRAMDSNFLRK